MKKPVITSLLFLALFAFSWPVSAVLIDSAPNSFDLELINGVCVVKPLTMLVSEGSDFEFDFHVSRQLIESLHLGRIDDSHILVYFHPPAGSVGKTINGIIYVSATPKNGIRLSPFTTITFPIEVTLHVKESADGEVANAVCPVLGDEVPVVPLSLDAVALLALVIVSLGVVNITARLRLRGRKV